MESSGEVAKSFKNSDEVILCPVYPAGEKVDKKFNYHLFGKMISKKSKATLIILKSENDLFNYFKKNLFNGELVICMGAGSISTWIRNISNRI